VGLGDLDGRGLFAGDGLGELSRRHLRQVRHGVRPPLPGCAARGNGPRTRPGRRRAPRPA
jgi:hypothetical protein